MDHRRERQRCLQVLELEEGASDDEIKKAYRIAALRYHPDKNSSPDATDKFQQVSAAYKYLTEGDSFLNRVMEDHDEEEDLKVYFIIKLLFPWLFEEKRAPPNHFYGYYDNDFSDDDDEYEDYNARFHYATSNQMPRGGAAQSNTGHYYHQPQQVPSGAGQSYRQAPESATSQYYRQRTNFTQANEQHGQYFQDTGKSKSKAAKKRRKDAKRAEKLAADKAKSTSANQQTSYTSSWNRRDDSASRRPNMSGQGQQRKESGASDPSRENSPRDGTGDTGNKTTEDQTNKKSKKQIQMEQKQREKEENELREQLEQEEREKKEKLEKKRAAQEEKERLEREAREEEERKWLEVVARQEEERRKQKELEEERKKAQRKEEERRRKLLAEFDRENFLDETGDFKYTDPDVINIIRRDDMNHLGNAPKSRPQDVETINGFNTEDLIELQNINLSDDIQRSPNSSKLGSPNHAKHGPIGSKPPNREQTSFKNQKNAGQQQSFQSNASGGYPHFSPPGQPPIQPPPGFERFSRPPLNPQQNFHQYQHPREQQQHHQQHTQQQFFRPQQFQNQPRQFQSQPRQNFRPPQPLQNRLPGMGRPPRPSGGYRRGNAGYPNRFPNNSQMIYQGAYPNTPQGFHSVSGYSAYSQGMAQGMDYR